jgi:catechol 2,3-dioxygenase-like lactoylglutathione lyase family enzyme
MVERVVLNLACVERLLGEGVPAAAIERAQTLMHKSDRRSPTIELQPNRSTRRRDAMFSHVMVGTNDLEASKKFYDAVLGTLGISPGFIDDNRRIFYISPTGAFAVSKPINGAAASVANGGTIGFAVADPATVDAWHAAGVANGGTSCEDPPGVREGNVGKMYLAYLRDPSGNKLCALHRMA